MRVSCVFQALAAVALVSAVALPDPRPADKDALNVSSDLKAATEPEDADAVAKADGLLKPIEDDINIYIYDRKGRRISRYGKDKKVLESEAYEEEEEEEDEDDDDDERDWKEEKKKKKKKKKAAEKEKKKKAAEKEKKEKAAEKAEKKKEAEKAEKKKEAEREKTPKEKEEAEREMNRKKAEWAASDKKKAADAKKKLEKQKAKEEKAVRDKKYQDEMHARKKATEEALKKAGMTKTVKQRRAECIKKCVKMILPILSLPCSKSTPPPSGLPGDFSGLNF
ncbi:hypothetical protein BN1708_006437 [Verticillium longisporum]|uniref:Uncharacterized protein n=1 Tax=Verticillium longisporum TaxID=100787 RepID=A0A0G4MJW2_VERLO|nr:hypothetical protein BN1708_006437 [Verticillium longisporum]